MRHAAIILILLLASGQSQALVPYPSYRETSLYETDYLRSMREWTTSPAYHRVVLRSGINRKNLYIRVSKPQKTLYVYERGIKAPSLVAAYPICIGKNRGHKRCAGDHRTPESRNGRPFIISQIQNSSQWRHDFGDGRGAIKAYGHWFLRLSGDYPGHSIGIHGSTGNRGSIPGRGSEGCIRLRDEDIVHLKENYAYLGMQVFIDGDNPNEK